MAPGARLRLFLEPDREPRCNYASSDLRLHPILHHHSPRSASWSDFVYALGPVFSLFWQQIEDKNEDKCHEEIIHLGKIIWDRWTSVWTEGTPQEQRVTLKDFLYDIKWESVAHRNYVRLGHKTDIDPIPWKDALEPAVTASEFQRWADPDYVQSLQPPPPPPPSPPPAPMSLEEALLLYEKEREQHLEKCRAQKEASEKEDSEGEGEDWMYCWH
ncbi:hypothetical protein V5O48_015403 [Marasmius crinis-equi]|uniref:Uncharacterized protein n=1 Tax=Marasmius crinis-equi TaxID=585013 RepID=A0ABR3EUN6_9AGAR